MGIVGKQVIESLAVRFPQLFIAPAEGAQDLHRLASGRGVVPEGLKLDHFKTSDEDELREVQTPAGVVDVVFLKNRSDFETFLQIIGHKAQPVAISRTVGAITYRGLADWGKVEQAKKAYAESGGDDWPSQFKVLASQPGAFRSELIVISEGPYSNVNAADSGFDEEEWLRISHEIRLHHECAHVVCRRLMPQDILPVWDEVTADAVGLLCAIGRYDSALAQRFLGVSPVGYTGGRLAEYLDDEQMGALDDMARTVAAACDGIARSATPEKIASPFDYLLELKAHPLLAL